MGLIPRININKPMPGIHLINRKQGTYPMVFIQMQREHLAKSNAYHAKLDTYLTLNTKTQNVTMKSCNKLVIKMHLNTIKVTQMSPQLA